MLSTLNYILVYKAWHNQQRRQVFCFRFEYVQQASSDGESVQTHNEEQIPDQTEDDAFDYYEQVPGRAEDGIYQYY